MKSGRAAVFAQRLLRTETELGTFPFPSLMTFRRGLYPVIEKDIAVSQHPVDLDDLQAWYERSRRYDMSQWTHDAFVGGNPRRAAPTAPTRSYINRPSVPNHGASTNPPPHAPPPPQRSDSTRSRPPMTIPDGRHQPKPNVSCELCGTPCHTGKTCYVRRRVRAMATDDRKDWFMNS